MRYVGPDFSAGPLPAVVYFILSSHASLNLDPFNQPVEAIKGDDLRIFSFSLPLHTGKSLPPESIIDDWAEHIKQGDDILHDALDRIETELKELIGDVIDPARLGFMGLSRGSWFALQLARRIPNVGTVCFAPMLDLNRYGKELATHDLSQYTEELSSKTIKFYMGNHDTRTPTKTAVDFILSLAQHAHDNRKRKVRHEMEILPSIGARGHGTAPETFAAGANWLKGLL